MSAPAEAERFARAALTWVAEPGDPVDQVGYLDRIKRTGTMARDHTGWNGLVKGGQLFDRHLANAGQRIRPLPEPREESALTESGSLDWPSKSEAHG